MLLSEEFISKYKDVNPPMTSLGEFVYYRTYSRYLPEQNRREYWWETVRRAVEYNCSLVHGVSIREAEQLFDTIFNLKGFLSGRTLWVGGTESSKKYASSNFNCFKSDTEFITKQGIKSFNDFSDGDNVDILSSTGGWKTATIRNFGKSKLVKLIVGRGKREDIIYTTENHRWYVKRYKSEKKFIVKTTNELKNGDILREKRRYEQTNIVPCSVGIQHGMVFGDGTYNKKMNHCRVHLVDNKQELALYFTTGSQCTAGKYNQKVIYGLPNTWKNLPSLNSNVEYLMGFVMGLFATDGSYYKSNISISNSNKNTLDHIKSIFSILGIDCGKVELNRELSPYTGEYAPNYRLNLYSKHVPDDFFLNSKHKSSVKETSFEPSWVVKGVEETDIIEDVWCVVEPETESFTLANNILTKNCSFTKIDNTEDICELFYLLLLGCGVGFLDVIENISAFSNLNTSIRILSKEYSEKIDKEEFSTLQTTGNVATIVVGDSKEGWVGALRYLFKCLENPLLSTILVDFDNVRPEGAPLKTFGGYASGHVPLKILFEKIIGIVSRSNGSLKTIDILDICNLVGCAVQVGGVRRTALVCLFDKDDEDVRLAKQGIYYQNEDGAWVSDPNKTHRVSSNNSILFNKRPSKEELVEIFNSIKTTGEPGFINKQEAQRRLPTMEGLNPCCFTGDMKLLTSKGYKTFKELNEKQIDIINADGNISQGKVWFTGRKPCIRLKMSNNRIIKCTEDHIFMLEDGSNCKAKDLKGKCLIFQSYCKKNDSIRDYNTVTIEDISHIGEHDVFDFEEPLSHWGIVNGFMVHNCEILLPSKGFCNLVEINVKSFVKDGELNEEILNAVRTFTRASYRMACVNIELPEWKKVQEEHMLLGVALSGWQDAVNLLYDKSEENQVSILKLLRETARTEATKIANSLGRNTPKLVTTIKPSGTLSLLPTISPGVHHSHSPYYIRRVRINSGDPLLKVAEELGYNISPEVGQDPETCDTNVIDFYVKSPEGKNKYDISAIEQLETYKMFMRNYTDHNTSITVTVRDNEWAGVIDWVYENWDDFVGISFLPLYDAKYPLAPYEAITEEEYNKLNKQFGKITPELIAKYEKQYNLDDDLGSDCENGVCPIR